MLHVMLLPEHNRASKGKWAVYA